MGNVEEDFLNWLGSLDTSQVKVYGIQQGRLVFAKEPLLRVEGPIGILQLLETPLLNMINFASLVTTNASRMKFIAGEDKKCIEFGLRRAQGPNGALTASKYSFLGGFDGTSNVYAGYLYGIPISGTHAHSFVMSFSKESDLTNRILDGVDLLQKTLAYRSDLGWETTELTELYAFISYAISFPNAFLALVDSYSTLNSGVKNFLLVALALDDLGYKAVGIRLDSGDLAHLSKEARMMF
jgi:nicotinate phosphoribosyltransferase